MPKISRPVPFLAIAAAVPLLGLAAQWWGRRRDAVRWPAPGRSVPVGGKRKLHLYELGSGQGATVIFEAGMCASSLNWRDLQSRIARFARTVSYDRAGLGWSTKSKDSVTPVNLADDLRRLLEEAHIDPPYVLVGHSFGSFVVHSFACRNIHDVAGVVMVDPLLPSDWAPLLPDQKRRLEYGIRLARRGALLARFGLIRLGIILWRIAPPLLNRRLSAARGPEWFNRLKREFLKIPRELWPAIVANWCKPEFFDVTVDYLQALPNNAREMLHATPLRGVPVIVITGDRTNAANKHAIASIAPGAELVSAVQSDHWVHLDEPEIVVRAIRQLVVGTVV